MHPDASPFLLALVPDVSFTSQVRESCGRDPSWLRSGAGTAIEKISGRTTLTLTLLQLLLGKYHLPHLEDEGKRHQENGYCRKHNKNLGARIPFLVIVTRKKTP